MVRRDLRSPKRRKEVLSHPSSPATGAADKITEDSKAAATPVGVLQERAGARRRRTLASASTDQTHLDCPRCGSADTRFRGSWDQKPHYFCSSFRRGWTRGAALRQTGRKNKKPHTPSTAAATAPPATHQTSHAAVAPGEASSQGVGLECPWGSAFVDWIDQFLQTRMQEDFKAAFLGSVEETGGCARPPSPPDADQEPKRKLQQQQHPEERPPLIWNRGARPVFN